MSKRLIRKADIAELRAFLDQHNIRQTHFAGLIGVTPRIVSNWVTGHTPPPYLVGAYIRVVQKLSPAERKRELGL